MNWRQLWSSARRLVSIDSDVDVDLVRRGVLRGAVGLAPLVVASPALLALLEEARPVIILPAAVDLGAELVAVVNRAFVKKLVVQIYNTSPLMAALLAKRGHHGGVISRS